jgi:hypothetical protein
VETTQIYLDVSSPTDTYNQDDSSTCSGTVGDDGCDVTDDIDGDGSADEDCTIADGEESCGTLTNQLVAGKTFVLEFWAKGNGSLSVTFEEEGGAGESRAFGDTVALDGSWALYSLGPLDTSAYEDFDENAVVRFATEAGTEFYLDNITLKQVEENITLIKDSWVVPSTCDQTPNGVDSNQYYLGCEAYTDHNGNDVDLFQFSDLCSEEVVGCDGFYATQNSQSPYTQVYNARCMYSTDTDFTDGETVSENTSCAVDEVEYCVIPVGQSYCTFDADQAFAGSLPVEIVSPSEYYGIVYGPETVVVSGDVPVYIVADDAYACAASVMGCQELGQPTYSQDQRLVESFESVYYLNLPADYDTLLCDHEALFCEEWESTQDGNFYFKDPLDKECEYKTSVTIDNRAYFGWFRSGTTQPCYWTDEDEDGEFDYGEEGAYLIAGAEFGVWTNGDQDDGDGDTWDAYDGWAAACDNKYDLCTEFVDVVDTGGGLNETGQSYYFTNDELLSEDELTDTQRCNGQVSQKFGCALFHNTTISELTYNASASYILSTYADVLFGTQKNDLVDPVSCTLEDGGVFEVPSDVADELNLSQDSIDLCQSRCMYVTDSGDSIDTPTTTVSDDTLSYERACLFDADCPMLTTTLGEQVSGVCSTQSSSLYRLQDDSNEVLKVDRDRTCASWLSCESSRTSWNTQTNMYDTICDSINLCVEGQQQGDRAMCSQWNESDPTVLSAYQYSSRDVSWAGYEFSGNAIPNQLPIELYDQFNIEAQTACVNTAGVAFAAGSFAATGDPALPLACASYADCPSTGTTACTDNADCGSYSGVCDTSSGYCHFACAQQSDTDYRLVYNAGPCDSTEEGNGNGGTCFVGQCEESETVCASDSDCDAGEACVVGYFQATGSVDCVNEDCSCNPDENDSVGNNADCVGVESSTGISTAKCDPAQFVCVDEFETSQREACVENSDTHDCVPSADSTVGACFNDRCLADVRDRNGDGYADPLEVDVAREESCRAYPEIDSPFPAQVVETWVQYSGTDVEADGVSPTNFSSSYNQEQPSSQYALPHTYVNGFQDSTLCALDAAGNPVECDCSYDKAEYGDGTAYRYFEISTGIGGVPEGICSGGPLSGVPCLDDDDCSTTDGDATKAGICTYITRVDSVYGWNGYCLEKDTSIQTLGSTQEEDQACLSWLPVDQLTGATDLYGKITSAGYPPQNTYYCADVKLGYNVRTSGIACAEVQDGECNDGGSNWAGFRNESDNSSSNQDDCVAGVWCPDGFFAVMTGCGKLDTQSECDAGGDADCPYFCVPKLSYKTQDDPDLNASAGDPCLTPHAALGIDVDPPPHNEETKSEVEENTNNGAYYLIVNDVADHWAGNDAPNIRVYVLTPDQFEDAKAFYNDCEAKGVTNNIGEFTYSEIQSEFEDVDVAVGNLLNYTDVKCGFLGSGDCGFRDLQHDFIPGAYCTSVVQVSSNTLKDEQNGAFDTYNAAWTDRLWEASNAAYSLNTLDNTHLAYTYLTEKTPYGAAVDYLQLEGDIDPQPHRLVMCQDEDYSQLLPTVELVCSAGVMTSTTGADARAYMEVEITAETEVVSDYCKEDDCNCKDGEKAKKNWCNWDSDLGAAASCVSGKCVGGGNDGNDCNEDTSCYVNYCHTITHVSSGLLISAECKKLNTGTDYLLQKGDASDAISSISQLFGRVYGFVEFDDDGYGEVSTSSALPTNAAVFGEYEPLGSFNALDIDEPDDFQDINLNFVEWQWDTRATAQINPEEHVPVVMSVGDCEGVLCEEGTAGKFSVNGVDSSDILGEGAERVMVSFFTYADSEQMPIRRIVVDWGDDWSGLGGDTPWPSGSQSGSIAPDNFYRNARGLDPVSNQEQCSSSETTAGEFGKYTSACSSSYVAFSHDYNCTTGRLASLKECNFDDETGRLLNSPCFEGEYCVFQPRVHVMDNWGWCTGLCDAGMDGTEGCYSGVTWDGEQEFKQNECNIEDCPSENDSGSSCDDNEGDIVNPWINYDGVVKLLAE